MQRTSSGKSHTVGSFLLFFSDECNKQEIFALPCKNASRYTMKDFIMTALYSHERYSSRRLLKSSNSPFFRQMLHVASTTCSHPQILPWLHVYLQPVKACSIA